MGLPRAGPHRSRGSRGVFPSGSAREPGSILAKTHFRCAEPTVGAISAWRQGLIDIDWSQRGYFPDWAFGLSDLPTVNLEKTRWTPAGLRRHPTVSIHPRVGGKRWENSASCPIFGGTKSPFETGSNQKPAGGSCEFSRSAVLCAGRLSNRWPTEANQLHSRLCPNRV